MCLIIVSYNQVKEDIFTRAAKLNPDGFSMMWVEDGEVHVEKELVMNSSHYRQYEHLIKTRPVILHWRLATQGPIDLNNCHPFEIRENQWMVHNGSLGFPRMFREYSDTWHFAKYLSLFPWEEYYRLKFWLGMGENKIVLLNGELNQIHIVNEGKGLYDKNNNWYSNGRIFRMEPDLFGLKPIEKKK